MSSPLEIHAAALIGLAILVALGYVPFTRDRLRRGLQKPLAVRNAKVLCLLGFLLTLGGWILYGQMREIPAAWHVATAVGSILLAAGAWVLWMNRK